MALELGTLMNIFDEDEAIALLLNLNSDSFEEESKKQNFQASSIMYEGCLFGSFVLRERMLTVGFSKEVEEKDDLEFFKHCRIGKGTFYELVEKLSVNMFYCRDSKGGMPPLSASVSVLMTLWYLQQRKYTEMAKQFGASLSSCHRHTNFVIDVLNELASEIITWPSAHEIDKVEEEFRSIADFPGVIGVIDSWRIQIRTPTENTKAYIDQDGNYSVNVIVVCDARKKITYANVGFEGGAENQRVFANSELGKRLEENAESCCYNSDYHLIGDRSFALKDYLIVPFEEHGSLDFRKCEFNRRLMETKRVADETRKWLKIRFSKMEYIEAYIQRIPKIITAMCVLHNLSMQSEWDVEQLGKEVEARRCISNLEEELWSCIPYENIVATSVGVHKRNAVLKSLK